MSDWLPPTRPGAERARHVAALLAAVILAVNAVVVLAGFGTTSAAPALAAGPVAGAPVDAEVAAAAVALATRAAGVGEEDVDPLAQIVLAPARPEISLDGDLPVPENPPVDPYAATPDVVHGTLSIPSIGVSQRFGEGITLTAINRGPSHWPGTAMPGELGNVVVAGHRTTYTRPFWDLQALTPGDELVFDLHDGSRHVYALAATEIVDPTAVHIVGQRREHTATLFACHPRGSARQRIVAHFRYVPEASIAAPQAVNASPQHG